MNLVFVVNLASFAETVTYVCMQMFKTCDYIKFSNLYLYLVIKCLRSKRNIHVYDYLLTLLINSTSGLQLHAHLYKINFTIINLFYNCIHACFSPLAAGNSGGGSVGNTTSTYFTITCIILRNYFKYIVFEFNLSS